jgi:hypothetical protein
VGTYDEWCTAVFGEGLSKGTVAKAKALRPNREILAAQQARDDRQKELPSGGEKKGAAGAGFFQRLFRRRRGGAGA